MYLIEYGIFGEGFQILNNQKRENSSFSLLIGRNLRPFPSNTVLYKYIKYGNKTKKLNKVMTLNMYMMGQMGGSLRGTNDRCTLSHGLRRGNSAILKSISQGSEFLQYAMRNALSLTAC